jgi:hypothetical protein
MTVPIILSLFISTTSFAQTQVQATLKPAETLPRCVRPRDFSNGKFVASYEACLKRQDAFCNAHKESKVCLNRNVPQGKPYFKTTVDDIDPSKRCQILKDGSYQCLQDPVRFMAPITQANAPPIPVQGAPSPVVTPTTSGPTSADVPVEDKGTGGDETLPQGAPVLPPPPKK